MYSGNVPRVAVTVEDVAKILVAAYEIAAMFGVSRQRVSQLTARPDFPEPFDVLQTGRVWLREDVEKWARERGRTIHDD